MNKRKLILNIVGILIICFHMVPIYITVTSAFKDKMDLSSKWSWPGSLNLDNIRLVLSDGGFYSALTNTLIIVLFSVIIVVIAGAMTGYVLARLHNRFTNIVLMLTIGVMMIPSVSLIVPLYKIMLHLDAINTYWGITLLSATYELPLSIFLYTNFVKTIPKELDEAAQIDGCNKFSIFYKIILPQLGPVTTSIIIVSGVKLYNEYLFALYFLQKSDMRLITTYVSTFFNEYSYINQASAAALFGALPAIIVYVLLQKHFVSGAMNGIGK